MPAFTHRASKKYRPSFTTSFRFTGAFLGGSWRANVMSFLMISLAWSEADSMLLRSLLHLVGQLR